MKVFRSLIILLAMIVLLPGLAMAANTLTISHNMLTYTSDGSANSISLATDGAVDAISGATKTFPNGVGIVFIAQKSHAANDAAIVRDAATTGDPIYNWTDIIGDGKVLYYGGELFKPVFKTGETTSGCIIKILITKVAVK